MVVEAVFVSVLYASLAGFMLSIVIEQLMTPRPPLVRPWAAWGLHAGLWLFAHTFLVLVLGRPWFAAASVSAFLLVLVLVSNAKFHSLREPFVFQDYEYFTDAIRHPRLYIPFLGWWKFVGAVAGFLLAVAIGLWGEAVPVPRLTLSGQLGGIATVFAVSLLFLLAGNKKVLAISFEPERDIGAMGLLASFWRYGQEERAPLKTTVSPFSILVAKKPDSSLPHLVAVQSESFFDARSLYPGIHRDVLAEFDRLKEDAAICGKLRVPAWGANTVRTEFAFLSGIDDDRLGIHRFNPYRAIANGGNVPSLAAFLKELGYRTVCVHPYPASFYRRDRVYPRFGFDEFLDIRTFENAAQFKPYVGDVAVSDKIVDILDQSAGPVFVFAITMENHGPLHLETPELNEVQTYYSAPPPPMCDDLTIYLRHLRNADRMISTLRHRLEMCDRPAGLCWYGDHVPIMPSVYETFGAPVGDVEFVLWNNCVEKKGMRCDMDAHDLSSAWLREMNLIT